MSGLFSQVLDNLSQMATSARALPSPSDDSQPTSEHLLDGLDLFISQSRAFQDEVLTYANSALAQLNDIQQQLDSPDAPIDQIEAEFRQVQQGAVTLSQQSQVIFDAAGVILNQLEEGVRALKDTKHGLDSNISALSSQLAQQQQQIAQESVPDIGPGLLFNMGDAAVDYQMNVFQNTLNSPEMMQLTMQSVGIVALIALMEHLVDLCKQGISVLTNVRNASSILTADLDKVFQQHNDIDKRVLLKLYVAQTISEVKTVISDVS